VADEPSNVASDDAFDPNQKSEASIEIISDGDFALPPGEPVAAAVGPVHPEPTGAAVLPPAAEGEKAPPRAEDMAASSVETERAAEPAGSSGSAVPDLEAEITDFLQQWKTAWEGTAGKNGDMAAYMAFYADAFKTNGLDKKGWEADKAAKNSRKSWINVELSEIDISPSPGGEVTVRFDQVYRSSNYADRSSQSLILVKEEYGWKIIR
jgi:hypothetical protein